MNDKHKKHAIVRFAPKGNDSFFEMVKAKVDDYFTANKLSRYATKGMWVKTVVMILLYVTPYVLMVTGVGASSNWIFLGFWALMGLGVVGIGTSVMHDANHGTYSAKKNVNSMMAYILEMIGGYSVTWKIQHNILHHTYTNVTGLDEDIDTTALLRFSPHHKLRWFHRFQFLYAWCLYAVMTLFWMTIKEYRQLIRYDQFSLLKKAKTTLPKAITHLTLYKLFYYGYIIALPLLFSGVSWWMVLVGFGVMHVIAGVALACIFQLAHVMETSSYAEPVMDEKSGEKKMEENWAVHQLLNTANYAPRNKWLSWFIGGLNYQIEHHLFPGVCHVHYAKLSPIIHSSAQAFGLPYNVQPTFLHALWDHARMLHILGRKPKA